MRNFLPSSDHFKVEPTGDIQSRSSYGDHNEASCGWVRSGKQISVCRKPIEAESVNRDDPEPIIENIILEPQNTEGGFVLLEVNSDIAAHDERH